MFGRDGYINKILGVEDAYRSSSSGIVLPKLEVITAAIFVLLFSTFVSQVLTACNTLATPRTTDVDQIEYTSDLIQSTMSVG